MFVKPETVISPIYWYSKISGCIFLAVSVGSIIFKDSELSFA